MKTSELSGAALDWAVAKCEGKENTWRRSVLKPYEYYQGVPYSTNWLFGGPIIERERIMIDPEINGGWMAIIGDGNNYIIAGEERGQTPLIAAMRCYVASKMGTEIDVPGGLK